MEAAPWCEEQLTTFPYSDAPPMSSPDDMLREAVADYQAGRLAEAGAGYHRVLSAQPSNHLALYGLALLSFRAGAKDETIDYVVRSLQYQPNVGPTWRWLGTLYLETGQPVEGKAAFKRVTELSPQSCEAWYDLAACVQREGDFDTAAKLLRRAVACPQPLARASESLANLLCRQGRVAEAARTVADWVKREPANPIARHMAAAIYQHSSPTRAPDDYVQAHFDAFADEFDSVLKTLKYQGPQLVAAALRAAAGDTATPVFAALLDAGCGTGLCGPLVRALCTHLVGVDLSANMLRHAQGRDCYDELALAELCGFMHSRPQAFDAIICADTFIYFGDLTAPLAAAHTALRTGGPFVFTVEALAPSDTAEMRLAVSGRYQHSEAYLRRVLDAGGFTIETLESQTARQDVGQDVPGFVVVARPIRQD
jgi:predicted TPR repeat methyltransferase